MVVPWRLNSGGMFSIRSTHIRTIRILDDIPLSIHLDGTSRPLLKAPVRNDSFKMYLLWQSPVPGSIPVPLRVTEWEAGFTGWPVISTYHSVDPPSQDTHNLPRMERQHQGYRMGAL